MKKTAWTILLLFLIAALALLLRLVGLKFGFPHLLHPDEPTALKQVMLFFSRDLNPRSFKMPSLYLYLLYFSSWIYWRVAEALGGSSVSPHLWADKTSFYLIGRAWAAVLGAATVVTVFLTGKKLYGDRTAFGGALLTAVLPIHVLHSHYATVDIPVTFLITLSFLLSAMILRGGGLKCYLAAGLTAGLAAGMKYNGAFTVFPLFLAHFLREGGEGGRGAREKFLFPLLTLLVIGAAFLLTSPFVIKENARFLTDLKTQSHYITTGGHGPIFIATRFGTLYFIFYVLYYAGGAVFWLMAMAGVACAVVRRRKADYLIFVWLVPYFILISIAKVKFSRFLIPTLPFLAILGARLLEVEFARRWKTTALRAAWGLGFVWILLYGASFSRLLSAPDVRLDVKEWIETNLPPGTRIGLIQTETGLIYLDDPPLEFPNPVYRLEQYKRLLPALAGRPEYLVVTNLDYRQILRLKELYDQIRYDDWTEFLRGDKGYEKVVEFDYRPSLLGISFGGPFPPHDMIYNRPYIAIFRNKGNG